MTKTVLQQSADASSFIQSSATTSFYTFAGYPLATGTETQAQIDSPAALTVRNLFTSVTINSLNGSTTLRTRKNAANGALSVSIGAGTTGTFQDTVDSDSLALNDNVNFQEVTGGTTGSIQITVWGVTIDQASTETSIVAVSGSTAFASGSTNFAIVNGQLFASSTESANQYTIRFAASWFRLNVNVTANGITKASTVTSRINGVNGAQTVSIGASATGIFEDTTHTDSLAAGNAIDWTVVVGTKVGATLTIIKIHSIFQTTPTDAYPAIAGTVGGIASIASASTEFFSTMGDEGFDTTESRTQTKVRGISLKGKNLFVRINTYSINGSSTFTTRINGANGSLTVSAAATGSFEDTTDTDSYAVGDLLDYRVVTGGTSGVLSVVLIGMELGPPGVFTSTNKATTLVTERITRAVNYSRSLRTDLHSLRTRIVTVKNYFRTLSANISPLTRLTRNVSYFRSFRAVALVSARLTSVRRYFRSLRADISSSVLARVTTFRVYFRSLRADLSSLRAKMTFTIHIHFRSATFRADLSALTARLTRNVSYSRSVRDDISSLTARLTTLRNYARGLRENASSITTKLTRNLSYFRSLRAVAVVSARLSSLRQYFRNLRADISALTTRLTRNVGYSRTFRTVTFFSARVTTVKSVVVHFFNVSLRAVAVVSARISTTHVVPIPPVVRAFFAALSTRFDEHTTRGRKPRI